MFSYMAVVVLSASISTASLSQSPQWLNDYGQAQTRVAVVKKPMAVFVGNGNDGWASIVRDGGIDPAVKKLLAEKFVCVYVNTDTAAGKTLAAQFDVASHGLIISDRSGATQAYSLSGTLTKNELAETLEKYADSKDSVRSTETVVREAPAGRAAYVPTYQYAPQYQVAPGYRIGGS
jgi:hypothetical protein